MNPRRILWVALGFLGASLVVARAQDFSLNWVTLDGGGGTSSSGGYEVSGTIGQPDTGLMSGGAYTLAGGFWPGLTEPAIGAPFLGVTNAGGSVVVSWLRPAEDFVLDRTPALASPPAAISWEPVSAATYQTNATHIFITIPSPTGQTFYRLRKP